MDRYGAFSRVERTLWTVWCYISEVVGRFFRPQPPPTDDRNLSPSEELSGNDATQTQRSEPHEVGSPVPAAPADLTDWSSSAGSWPSGDMEEAESEHQTSSREEPSEPTGNDEAELFLLETTEYKEENVQTAKFGSGGHEERESALESEEGAGSVVETMSSDMDEHQPTAETGTEDNRDDSGVEDSQRRRLLSNKCSKDEKKRAEDKPDYTEGVKTEDEAEKEGSQLSLENFSHEAGSDECIVPGPQVRGEIDAKLLDNRFTAQKLPLEEKGEETLSDVFVTSGQEDVQRSRLHTTQDTDREEDVPVSTEQTTVLAVKTSQTSVSDDREGEKPEEEEFSSKVDNKDGAKEKLSTSTPFTVNPEGQSEQETSRELKNIPPQITEGRIVVLQRQSPPVREETREGVPGNDNELDWDEKKTHRFLRGGNCEEIQIAGISEEEEEEEDNESFKNRATSEECLPLRHNEDQRTELSEAKEAEEPTVVSLVSGNSFGGAGEKRKEGSMRDEFKPPDKKFESSDGLAGEMEKTEESECQTEGRSCVSKEREDCEMVASVGEEELLRFSEENLNLSEIRTVLDSSTHDFQKPKPENEIWRDFHPSTNEIHRDAADWEQTDHVGHEKRQIQQYGATMDPDVEQTTAAQIKEQEDKTLTLFAAAEGPQTGNQIQHGVVEMSYPARTSPEGSDKAWAFNSNDYRETLPEDGDVTWSETTETKGESGLLVEDHDVIDEDILDLWIETAMSQDTCETLPFDRDEAESHFIEDLTHRETAESNSCEFLSLTDTFPASDSAFLHQCFSETELLKSTSSNSPYDLPHERASPADSCIRTCRSEDELIKEEASTEQPLQEAQEFLTEVTAYTLSSDAKHQVLDIIYERPESGEMEVDVSPCGFGEGADSEELKTKSVSLQATEENPQEHIRDCTEISQLTKPKYQNGTDALLQDAEALTPEKHQHRQAEAMTGLHFDSGRAAETYMQQLLLLRVNSPALDFAVQRSRIEVKNPLVRPPTNPRSLLQTPSADPSPSPSEVKPPAAVRLGGMGVGVRLPGLGVGFPVLKKTNHDPRDENKQEKSVMDGEKQQEEESDATHRPKKIPSGLAGFGNPLLSEVKTKLRKTT